MAGATGRVAAYRMLRRAASHLAANTDRLADPAIQRMTREYLEAKAGYARDSVVAVVRMGGLLRRGKRRLAGDFCRWLGVVATSSSTASCYMAVAQLAATEPRVIRDFREIGIHKIARIARLTVDGRRRVLARRGVEELIRLPKQAFMDLTRPHLALRRPARRGPSARTMLRRVQWLQEALHDSGRVHGFGPELAKALRRLAARARALTG